MVNIAEAQSTGAVMVRYETSYTDDNITSPMYTKSKRLAQFFARSREYFVDRSSIAPVAVLYSYGSVIWRSFGSLRTDGGASTNYVGTHLHWTNVAGRLLEDNHVPSDVILLGVPKLFDDTLGLAALRKYKYAVLACADAVSDAQVSAISEFVRSGGTLQVWMANITATKHSNFTNRTHGALEALEANPGSGKVVRVDIGDATEYDATNRPDTGAGARILQQFLPADSALPFRTSELPRTVWLEGWCHGGSTRTIHFVNYDVAWQTDSFIPVDRFEIQLSRHARDCASLPGASENPPVARFYTPDSSDGAIVPVTWTAGGWAAKVPGFADYGVLAVAATEEELLTRAAAAITRKWLNKKIIADRVRPHGPSDSDCAMRAAAATKLASIQGRDAPALLPKQLESLRNDLENTTATLAASVDAITNDTSLHDEIEELAATVGTNNFVFGRSLPMSHWLPVNASTAYTSEKGFGWAAGSGSGVCRLDPCVEDSSPDPLVLDSVPDLIRGRSLGMTNATFVTDVPPGEYIVVVLTVPLWDDHIKSGDDTHVANTWVRINDAYEMYCTMPHLGRWTVRATPVTVRPPNTQLRLEFGGGSGGSPNDPRSIGWEVSALLVLPASAHPLPAAVARALVGGAVSRSHGIHQWQWLGPFSDLNATAFENELGVEQFPVDLQRTHTGLDGRVLSWSQYEATGGGAPLLPLGHLAAPGVGATAYALAVLQCNASQAGRATLRASRCATLISSSPKSLLIHTESRPPCTFSSAQAVGYFNGREVFRDNWMAGLLQNEEQVPAPANTDTNL